MEAAHVVWERGHKVFLMEANPELGGQLNLASLPPGRKEIENFRNFLQTRLQRTDVKILKPKSATAAFLKEYSPDGVILAAGAHPRKYKVNGLEEGRVISAWETLRGRGDLREPVLVLGAGLVGCEAADLLSQAGKKVILVEVLPEIAMGGDADTKAYFNLKFKKNGVEVFTGSNIDRVEDNFAVLQRGKKEIRVQVGTVVCAVGADPNGELYDELISAGLSVIKIGDCIQPRTLLEAIQEGFQAGRSF
jgi:NADPH-dependent 2,4-dienoyl-CoA reductase/sulfur reductase-like enzyme